MDLQKIDKQRQYTRDELFLKWCENQKRMIHSFSDITKYVWKTQWFIDKIMNDEHVITINLWTDQKMSRFEQFINYLSHENSTHNRHLYQRFIYENYGIEVVFRLSTTVNDRTGPFIHESIVDESISIWMMDFYPSVSGVEME